MNMHYSMQLYTSLSSIHSFVRHINLDLDVDKSAAARSPPSSDLTLFQRGIWVFFSAIETFRSIVERGFQRSSNTHKFRLERCLDSMEEEALKTIISSYSTTSPRHHGQKETGAATWSRAIQYQPVLSTCDRYAVGLFFTSAA